MLRSAMRASATAAILLLCFAVFTFIGSHDGVSSDTGADQAAIRKAQRETNIEVLRKDLLYWIEVDARRRKAHAEYYAALHTANNQALAILALMSCLLLAFNAWALWRDLRSRKAPRDSSNAL